MNRESPLLCGYLKCLYKFLNLFQDLPNKPSSAQLQTMKKFYDSCQKLKQICCCLWARISWFLHYMTGLLSSLLYILLFQAHPFWIKLGYLITVSSLGFMALKASKLRSIPSYMPKNNIDLDLFFFSVSAVTASSMSTVEPEIFSNTQLVFVTILMFLGGEVFISMLSLHRKAEKIKHGKNIVKCRIQSHGMESDSSNQDTSSDCNIELGVLATLEKTETILEIEPKTLEEVEGLKFKSVKSLTYIVFCYLLVAQVAGSSLISVYLTLVPSARKVLENKGLNLRTFTMFMTVSTFANCGFVPTNESMMVFRENSGLLLILIPQILMGNTLYPVCLRLTIWFLEKISKKAEFRYMLKNSRELGFGHLFPGMHSVYLAITALGLIAVQLVVFWTLEWNSGSNNGGGGGGASVYQNLVGTLFQSVNSRHAGECVFNLSDISPAILVLFLIMMYLPPYTSFLPIDEADHNVGGGMSKRKKEGFVEYILFSQLSYLAIFTILICITERDKMKTDPLNFSVFNIIFEVISAYGNVGFSVGYSCARQVFPDGECKDSWCGFVGRWSNEGKFIIIIVMLFGRLKKFNKGGGKAWSVS